MSELETLSVTADLRDSIPLLAPWWLLFLAVTPLVLIAAAETRNSILQHNSLVKKIDTKSAQRKAPYSYYEYEEAEARIIPDSSAV
mmetsp:Transcript_71337/g.143600  ORF Transcript_71337/g.143600 Transcript_71337/m.143600 type:complete len:86 (-) Transcript_71337:113-370(-)